MMSSLNTVECHGKYKEIFLVPLEKMCINLPLRFDSFALGSQASEFTGRREQVPKEGSKTS